MTDLTVIEQDWVFYFCAISYDTIVSYNGISSYIRPFSNLTIPSYDSRSFNHHSMLDYSPLSNKDIFIYMNWSNDFSLISIF